MKYDHLVKYNGILYKAGQDVPISDEVKAETTKEPEFKKSDISRMNADKLKELGGELEIEDADKMTGEALKVAIIEKLGL